MPTHYTIQIEIDEERISSQGSAVGLWRCIGLNHTRIRNYQYSRVKFPSPFSFHFRGSSNLALFPGGGSLQIIWGKCSWTKISLYLRVGEKSSDGVATGLGSSSV